MMGLCFPSLWVHTVCALCAFPFHTLRWLDSFLLQCAYNFIIPLCNVGHKFLQSCAHTRLFGCDLWHIFICLPREAYNKQVIRFSITNIFYEFKKKKKKNSLQVFSSVHSQFFHSRQVATDESFENLTISFE